MGRATEPGVKLPVILEIDQHKTPTPTIYVRALNGRDSRELGEEYDAIFSAEDSPTLHDRTFDLLRKCVVGWENQTNQQQEPIPYDPANLDLILMWREALEIIREALAHSGLTMDDKKKLDLPP
jgi:hypothetical protein